MENQLLKMTSKTGRKGLTLIEVIIVITILSMILAFSVVILRSTTKELSVTSAASHIYSLLTLARQLAKLDNTHSWIVLNVQEKTCHLLTKETIQSWHFEDYKDRKTSGAFGKQATVKNYKTLTQIGLWDGVVGKGFKLSGGCLIEAEKVPVYNKYQGILVEFWLNRDDIIAEQKVISIGDTIEIGITRQGMLLARVGKVSLKTPHPLAAYQWFKVQLEYNLNEARLYLNDDLVDSANVVLEWNKEYPLIVGDQRKGVAGIIDELMVSLITPREQYSLPGEVHYILPKEIKPNKKGELVIYFDSEGRLDRSKHKNQMSFNLNSSSEDIKIVIDTNGNILKQQK